MKDGWMADREFPLCMGKGVGAGEGYGVILFIQLVKGQGLKQKQKTKFPFYTYGTLTKATKPKKQMIAKPTVANLK